MKYGPIICDPTSEEAQALIGKRVLGGYNYVEAINGTGEVVTLESINSSYLSAFLAHNACGTQYTYAFIREVIEEPPQYRPYNNTEEMIADFCQRFGIVKNEYSLPMIWIRDKERGTASLVTHFTETNVLFRDLDRLFDYYTYLDGSPVGKEVNG